MDPNYLLLAACFLLTFRIGRRVLATIAGLYVLVMLVAIAWPSPPPAELMPPAWGTPTFAERWAFTEPHQ